MMEDVSWNLGVKLLDMYKIWNEKVKEGQGYVDMEMERIMRRSKIMKNMKVVMGDLMRNWCK